MGKLDHSKLLSKTVTNLQESATIRMARLAGELKSKGEHVINLSLGEPDFDTPNYIKEAANQALIDGYTKYTPVPGLPELREAISNKFRSENNLDYKPDQIVVSNGAKQSIANLALSLLNPADEAILFAPYWVSYYQIIELAGGVPIPLHSSVESDFKVTPQQLDAAITPRTKFILYSSPCNPTGSVYSKTELEKIAAVLEKHPEVMVLSDEIYEYINFSEKHFSIGSIPSMANRTVTINGMSKGFAMTGWRLGFIGAPKWLAQACSKIQGQFTSGASAFGQKAAVTAIEGDRASCDLMREAYKRRKVIAKDLFNQIPGVKTNDPQGAFYIFPDISHFLKDYNPEATIQNADEMAEHILLEGKVATVSGTAFGNDRCIRISFAASDDEIREAIKRIGQILTNL